MASKPQHVGVTAPAPVSYSSTPRGFTSEQKAPCKQTEALPGRSHSLRTGPWASGWVLRGCRALWTQSGARTEARMLPPSGPCTATSHFPFNKEREERSEINTK